MYALLDIPAPPVPAVVRLYGCTGCGRSDLTYAEMGKDRSKPNGLHSRCAACKSRVKHSQLHPPDPEPVRLPAPVRIDAAAIERRDAILELIKRHQQELDDIMWSNRYRSRPTAKSPKEDRKLEKVWVNLGKVSL